MSDSYQKTKKQPIPRTLDECTHIDSVSETLWQWAERVESWGAYLFAALLLIGIISTISNVVAVADDEELIFPTLLTTAVTWGLYAIIELFTYLVLALLIRALGTITQNTVISARVALYTASKTEDKAPVAAPRQPVTPTHKPAAPVAQTATAATTPAKSVPANQASSDAVEPIRTEDGDIICPICKTKQRGNRTICWHCARKFTGQ